MTVGFGVCFGVFLGGRCIISGFFIMNIQEEHLLMPTAEVMFSSENLRYLAVNGLTTTGSTKCT